MTFEELVAEIDERIEELHNAEVCDSYIHALRAVVELHKPDGKFQYSFAGENNPMSEDEIFECCDSCFMTYPCPTIQAIEKELQ